MASNGLRQTDPDDREALGIGLLGYGFMGKAHSNAWRTIPYIFWPSRARPELAGITGRTEASVAEAAKRYGFREWSTSWEDVVENPGVQIFDNVGPDDVHVEPTMAAIRAGKHVVCEKPLALTAADAIGLHQAAEDAGVKHLTCFNYRFFPAVRLAYELIRGGELGNIHQARFRYSQDWRTNPEADLPAPAGALTIIGCHAVDQARFLIGEIEHVSGAFSSPVTTPERTYDGRPVDPVDTVTVLAEFAGGVVGSIDASLVSPGRKNQLAWEINGSKGSVAWDLEELNVLRVHRVGSGRTQGFTEVITCEQDHPLADRWWPSAHILGWEHGHINMLAHFVQAVAEDTPVEPYGATFYDGARAAIVDEAVKESAESGRRVAVPAGVQVVA